MRNSELIMQSLDQLFPDVECQLHHKNHFELLIAVVLSAQTTDERVNSVTPELFEMYPDAHALADAELSDVERIIRPIGLYHNKAINIIKLSKVLCEYYEGKVPDSREDLEALPGVGRKTANVVRAFGFGLPVVATDVGGLPEAVRDDKTGYIVPPGDKDALASAIIRFFTEEKALEFKENIKDDEKRFSWENMVMTINGLYKEITA